MQQRSQALLNAYQERLLCLNMRLWPRRGLSATDTW